VGRVNPQLWWFVARSSGLVAWALLTAAVVFGLATSTGVLRRHVTRPWTVILHRHLATLSVVFTGVHLLALWADSFVAFGPLELLVPFRSTWRPGAVAWGIVTLYLLAAVQATSLLMRRIPRRVWRAVHQLSFVLFATATVHGLQAGTDDGALLVAWAAMTGCSLVLFLVLYRVLSRSAVVDVAA
jgi:predicted ferric reductase